MVAKLLVHAATRPEAIARAKRALAEFVVEGVHTTIPLHLKLLRDSPFKDGAVDTKYLERTMFPAGD
jgi:acetyl-CoA carboxylase biotin carboxylase subunit